MQAGRADAAVQAWLAERTNTSADDWFLVSRARHGMAVVFGVLAQQYGAGQVLTQPLTCVTAVNPIVEAGHRPIYADISADTLAMLPEDAAAQASELTRAVVVQHSFGIPAPIDEIAAQLRAVWAERPPIIIEDSAHYLGLLARGSGGEPVADVSVHSFGAEKMLRTKYGGAIWVSPAMADQSLRATIVEALAAVPPLGLVGRMQVAAYPYGNKALYTLPAAVRPLAGKVFRASGLFVQPIMPSEARGRSYGTCRKPSDAVLRGVLDEMANYDEQLAHRRERVAQYAHGLAEADCMIPGAIARGDGALVRFPLLLASAQKANEAFAHLQRVGLSPGKWYRPLLFPGVGAAEQASVYGYSNGQCPVAEDVSARIINLPTGPAVSEEKAKEIMRELRNTIAE